MTTDSNKRLREALEEARALLGRAWSSAGDEEHDYLSRAIDVLDAALSETDCYFECPECGPRISVDEDGCCVSCGRDAVEVAAARPDPVPHAEGEEEKP